MLLVRFIVTRSFDRWFAAGYAIWVTLFIASEVISRTDLWSSAAAAILKL